MSRMGCCDILYSSWLAVSASSNYDLDFALPPQVFETHSLNEPIVSPEETVATDLLIQVMSFLGFKALASQLSESPQLQRQRGLHLAKPLSPSSTTKTKLL